ncbi:MAG: glycerophosphodiester phosphodiesterase family protein [Gemmataceae bacterium]|nr:glycerophosphodiester phosphodiesterase family protein [Gemmataceae bacterium]
MSKPAQAIASAVFLTILCLGRGTAQDPGDIAPETAAEAVKRHAKVAERREKTHIICHRGAHEFAVENTMEAYRAALELGADGNEIDIRMTKDGVVVCFHDDMLDRLLEGYGTVRETNWADLQKLRFRNPGAFGKHCRIPTLLEVLLLHRKHAGLLHLDIKEPDLDRAIAALLDRLDMWDHVAYCNDENAGDLRGKIKLCRYKSGLYQDRAEVDPQKIKEALAKPGEGLIVDDPRGVLFELGRPLGKLSKDPVNPMLVSAAPAKKARSIAELLAVLRDADDWDQIAESAEDQAKAGVRIVARAQAAEELLQHGAKSKEVFAALADRVRKRSLHKHWMYHGLDGAMALRSLILLRAPEAVELARFVLWRDDPDLANVANPKFKTPRAWTDFRVQMVIFPALEYFPGADTQKLCRDYLAQSDEKARDFGPPALFEQAAKTLLTIRPETPVALELMKHRRGDVRGRAILVCLRHGDQPWARTALERGAPHALAYLKL